MIGKLVEELIESGLTEKAIVGRLNEIGTSTTQPTINRIKKGVIVNVKYDLGTAIAALHAKVCRKGRSS